MRLCPNCFADRSLQRIIAGLRPFEPNEKCSFHPRSKGVAIRNVCREIEEVFQANFDQDPGLFDDETLDLLGPADGLSLTQVVKEIAQPETDAIAKAVADELIREEQRWLSVEELTFYDELSTYVPTSSTRFAHGSMWREFRQSVRHEQRFFNSAAKETIARIFEGIHLQRDSLGNPAVYMISPDEGASRFFRCRIANDLDTRKRIKAKPEKELGPPPERLRRPGRMNPAGIPAFYGAYSMDTCVSELRPPVGSVVAGAQFELIRPIWVLDTTRFQRPGRHMSYFESEHRKRVEQWAFMQSFRHEISQPILPDDEYIDYIPTQAVAEYICHHHEFSARGGKRKIDAIVFNSAQDREKGKNIVIVGPSAYVGYAPANRFSSPFRDPFDDPHAPKPAVQLVADSVEFRTVESAVIKTVLDIDDTD